MKVYILSRGDKTSNKIKEDIRRELLSRGVEEEEADPELVISVGGDGTMLEAFHRYRTLISRTAFVGVHTGRLGFYADWLPHETEELIERIVQSTYKVVTYPVLEINVGHEHDQSVRYLALNECMVKTREGSLVMNVEINGEHFETFRGDGLCISTPSGSTAYNKSLGGAIVHPSLPSLQIAEMASINNRIYRTIGSSLLLPEHHQCVLKPQNDVAYQVTIDHLSLIEEQMTSMSFKIAPEKVRFARFRPFPFWKRVRDSFI